MENSKKENIKIKYSGIFILIISLIVIIILASIFIEFFQKNSKTSNKIILKSNNKDNIYQSDYTGNLGSAGSMTGNTVIVSIFASGWNFQKEADIKMMNDILNNLKTATNYLSMNAERYDKTATFICDWNQHSDLKYTTKDIKLGLSMSSQKRYNTEAAYLKENINSDNLKNKYRADNIIYMFFFNTWETNYKRSHAYMDRDFELINIYTRINNQLAITPSVFAHEIMHTFGAPDLYETSRTIGGNYVAQCKFGGSKDIMFTTSHGESAYGRITEKFSDLDAYYVGLINNCVEVKKWNLGKSQHITK